jgi:hypothetical protein
MRFYAIKDDRAGCLWTPVNEDVGKNADTKPLPPAPYTPYGTSTPFGPKVPGENRPAGPASSKGVQWAAMGPVCSRTPALWRAHTAAFSPPRLALLGSAPQRV